jgi:drug/metabolite transporter (DMT)-like permease
MVARLDLPGLQIAFWRLLLGAVLYGLVFFGGGRRVSLQTIRLVAPAGALLAGDIGAFFVALHSTTVANATTIGALQTIVLLAVASRRFREDVGPWLVGAALVAVGGVALVMFGSGTDVGVNLRGDILAVVAMLLFSAYFVVVKDVRNQVDTFTLQTVSMAVGALVVLPLAAIDAGTVAVPFPTGAQWVWLVALLAVPGTGHLLMNWAHLHIPLSLAGMLTLAIPVISGLSAWLVVDQQIRPLQGMGMAVVIGVLILVVRRDAGPGVATG